jgi:hypothetical protein
LKGRSLAFDKLNKISTGKRIYVLRQEQFLSSFRPISWLRLDRYPCLLRYPILDQGDCRAYSCASFSEAYTHIPDADANPPLGVSGARYDYRFPFPLVFDRIGEKIDKDLLQPESISTNKLIHIFCRKFKFISFMCACIFIIA